MSDYLTNNSMKETCRGYPPWWHPKDRVDFGMLSTPSGKAGGLQILRRKGLAVDLLQLHPFRLFIPLVLSGRLWSPPTFATIGYSRMAQ
jgi:hypothetical protein